MGVVGFGVAGGEVVGIPARCFPACPSWCCRRWTRATSGCVLEGSGGLTKSKTKRARRSDDEAVANAGLPRHYDFLQKHALNPPCKFELKG